MQQLYHDAMALVQEYGTPDLFITMTANPNWPEISRELHYGQTAIDRPDIVARVFRLKLKSLVDDLTKKNLFGRIQSWFYVIEFQKRGLPHTHLLIILEKRGTLKTAEDIDALVCAEIPDPDQEPMLHDLVSKCMLHGPCGPTRPCWVKGKCRWNFPKHFSQETLILDNSFPQYRRRQNGRTVTKHGHVFHNGHVSPYNKVLSLKYSCHINVEIPSGIKAIKYLYKYLTKGEDRARMALMPETSTEGAEGMK